MREPSWPRYIPSSSVLFFSLLKMQLNAHHQYLPIRTTHLKRLVGNKTWFLVELFQLSPSSSSKLFFSSNFVLLLLLMAWCISREYTQFFSERMVFRRECLEWNTSDWRRPVCWNGWKYSSLTVRYVHANYISFYPP